MKENIIADKTYEFAVKIVNVRKELIQRKEFVLSKQLLKSGTSIGANVEEAIGGISKKDFRAKMSISYKEARETQYWLKLLRDTDYLKLQEFEELKGELTIILKILYRIVQNSKD